MSERWTTPVAVDMPGAPGSLVHRVVYEAEVGPIGEGLDDANGHLSALVASSAARHLEEVAARLPAKQKTTKRRAKR